MNKYSDKSDFEINVRVANILLEYGQVTNVMHINEDVLIFDKNSKSSIFNPCNNPADAMPIVIENKICMAYDVFAEERDGGSWVAQPAYGFSDERVRSDNYYRSAMICFLIMKDAENES